MKPIPRIVIPAKAGIQLLLLPLLLGLPMLSANAQQPSTTLPAWDQLSDMQRAELVAPLRDRWNRSPEERPRMLERAHRWQASGRRRSTRMPMPHGVRAKRQN